MQQKAHTASEDLLINTKPKNPKQQRKKENKRVLVLGYKSLVITAANLYIYY